ncbi:MAG: DMT family transporter [Acidobacteriia bacterium]|nr:DMT family transporter [Terriglobia bacterium]
MNSSSAPSPAKSAPGRAFIVFSVALIVAIWAVNFIAAKIGLRHLSPLTMGSFRVVFAGLAMLPTYLFCLRLPAFAEAAAARRRRFSLRDYATFAYLGFFGVVVNQICFTAGLHYTSVTHASVIVGMGPIYILVLAVLLRLERWTWRKAGGMAIALAGVTLMAGKSGISTHSPTLHGDFITLCGSVGFSIYAVLGKRVAGRYDALTMTAYNHFAGALFVLPLALFEARRLGFAPDSSRGPAAAWRAIPWQTWAATAYMAVFGSVIAYLFYYWLLRFMPASQVSAFTYLLPVSATILGILWLGEQATRGEFLGAAVVLLGVYTVESARAPASSSDRSAAPAE